MPQSPQEKHKGGKNAEKQLGKISFDWTEVTQRVRGQLPIFEQVIDLGNRGKIVHKQKVQDYTQVVDLHLPGREIVIRLCDRFYQYPQGISLSSGKEINSRIQWNNLLAQIDKVTELPQDEGFTRFGKPALEFINLLPAIHPNLEIDRRAPSDWDVAFHLYSALGYFKPSKN